MGGIETAGMGGALGREELLARIESERPLISGYHALDEQLQPNGFDLSVAEVGMLTGPAVIGRANVDRVLPEVRTMAFAADGWLDLPPGSYHVVFHETVDLPNDLMALGRPRSSLCRGGASVVTAVWDAGYRGRSTAMLVVANPAGLRLERGARIMQLVFFTLNAPTARGYDGAYQGENLTGAVPVQSRRAK
jgi:dUTP pyrophosphatase